jgi:hypothetical protein
MNEEDYRPRYFSYDPRTHEVTPIVCENHDDEVLVWGKEFGDFDRRRIATTDMPDGGRVSTIFLGLDHSYGLGEQRELFETMYFTPDGSGEDMDRYATYDDAIEGHWLMVEEKTK